MKVAVIEKGYKQRTANLSDARQKAKIRNHQEFYNSMRIKAKSCKAQRHPSRSMKESVLGISTKG